jgi:hypothetical protein
MAKTLLDRLVLSLPAPWIDHVDRDFASNVESILSCAADQFNDALVACEMFKPFDHQLTQEPFDVGCEREPREGHLRSIYARAYLYSLDATRAFVVVLSRQPGISPPTVAACDSFIQRYGYIRGMRNSLQHIEERVQGKGSHDKTLPVGLLIQGSFIGRRFCVTTDSGQHAEVEISEQFAEAARTALLEIIWSFDWLHVGNVRAKPPEGMAARQ